MSDAITHQAACDKHSDELWDAVALLDAAAERLSNNAPSLKDDPQTYGVMHNVMRLVTMAKERAAAAATDLGNAL